MKTFLKTTYPCLIKTDTSAIDLDTNDILEIVDESLLFVFPQNGGIPFYVDSLSEQENQFVSIIKKNDSTYFLLEPQSNVIIEKIEKLNINGFSCTIVVRNNQISFKTDSTQTTCQCTHCCSDYNVFKYKSFACIQFDNDFYAYQPTKNKLFHLNANDIVFENGKLSGTKYFNDSIGRKKTAVYLLSDTITPEEEKFYIQAHPQDENLLSFRFVEAIKAKDFEYAFDCLSEELKTKIKPEQLKSFFQDFTQFLPLSLTEFLILYDNKKSYAHFEILNNKISDITLDDI